MSRVLLLAFDTMSRQEMYVFIKFMKNKLKKTQLEIQLTSFPVLNAIDITMLLLFGFTGNRIWYDLNQRQETTKFNAQW